MTRPSTASMPMTEMSDVQPHANDVEADKKPSQRGGRQAKQPLRFPARYLTQQKPTGKSNGFPRYYWSPHSDLVRAGFLPVRVPHDWRAFTDGERLLEAAIESAHSLNASMDRARALQKVVDLQTGVEAGQEGSYHKDARELSDLRKELETTKRRLAQSTRRETSLVEEVARLRAENERQSLILRNVVGAVECVNLKD